MYNYVYLRLLINSIIFLMYVLLCDECILSCSLLTFYTYTISCDGITLLYICPILTLSPLLNSKTSTKNLHLGTCTRYTAGHGNNKYQLLFYCTN